MIKKQPEPIKEILKAAIKDMTDEKKRPFGKEDIESVWVRAAGKEASRHSSPTRIKGNALIVNVDSPTWIYQLNIKRNEIEKKLNKIIKLDRPLSIRFRAGER